MEALGSLVSTAAQVSPWNNLMNIGYGVANKAINNHIFGPNSGGNVASPPDPRVQLAGNNFRHISELQPPGGGMEFSPPPTSRFGVRQPGPRANLNLNFGMPGQERAAPPPPMAQQPGPPPYSPNMTTMGTQTEGGLPTPQMVPPPSNMADASTETLGLPPRQPNFPGHLFMMMGQSPNKMQRTNPMGRGRNM